MSKVEEADKEDAGDAPVSTDEDDGNLKEDSGEREGHHYDDNRMSDDDHIKAIEHHLAALKDDRDYDDDHIDENKDEGNEEIEEASTPKRNAQGREPARRIRKEQLDAVVKKAIKEALQKRKG